MKRLIHGVGINDASYETQPRVNGKVVMCRAYQSWKNMLMRAYCPSYQARQPTYRGVTVCEEWHRFSNFKRWYDEHYVEGWQLDKDLLTDSREYGPSTCVFVPSWLNKLTTNRGASRGDWPLGVSWDNDALAFRASCRNPITNRTEYRGLFASPEEAHRAWLDRKVELAYQLKDWMDAIDRRIYFRVVELIFGSQVICE